jgi:hypothetical protein
VLAPVWWLRKEKIVLNDDYSSKMELSPCYEHFDDRYDIDKIVDFDQNFDRGKQ